MSSSKFESLWHLMGEHTFMIDGDLPKDVVCSICSKLMIEPHAAECGCQFCAHCIRDYLNGEAKKCPGSNEGCSEESLEIDLNVFKDVRTNHIIKKVVVRCPYQGCSFQSELEKIEEHLSSCPMKPVLCPFVPIGCVNGVTFKDGICDHLEKEVVDHSRLLMDIISSLTTRVNELTQAGDRREKEVRDMREEISKNRSEMDVIKEGLGDLKTAVDSIKAEIINRKNVQEASQGESPGGNKEVISNSQSLSTLIKEMKEDLMALKTEVKLMELENVKGSISGLKANAESIDKEMTKVKEEYHNLRKENEDLKWKINQLHQSLVTRDTDGAKVERTVEKVIEYSNENSFEINDWKNTKNECSTLDEFKRDFVWIIKDFSKMICEAASNPGNIYFSEPFCKYNYKCCMSTKVIDLQLPKGNLYFEIYANIMKGERDHGCDWPMKHVLEISLVNQNTMAAHKVRTYFHDTYKGDMAGFSKPMKDMNVPIGGLSLTVHDLKNIEGLIFKDTVMVACSLINRPQ